MKTHKHLENIVIILTDYE